MHAIVASDHVEKAANLDLDNNRTGSEAIGAINFVAVVMDVPPDIAGRELEVDRDPALPHALGVPCLNETIDDPDLAKTTTFSSVLSGYTLRNTRYRIEVPAGLDGRANLRLTLK